MSRNWLLFLTLQVKLGRMLLNPASKILLCIVVSLVAYNAEGDLFNLIIRCTEEVIVGQ